MQDEKNTKENQLIEKINRLKERLFGTDRDDHLETVEEWEKDAKRAIMLKGLQNHEGIKIIVEHITSDIDRINGRLKSEKSDTITDSQRDAMIDIRDYMEWFLNLFVESKSTLESVEESVDNQLQED